MSFSKYSLSLLTFLLLLMPLTVVYAGSSQEFAIAEDSSFLELAGSAFWNRADYCDIVGDYAYINMIFGLMIVDVSDKTDPQAVSRLYMPSKTYRLQVVGDYVYICGGGDISAGIDWATLTIVDVSDVYNPYVVGCYQHPDSIAGYAVQVIDGVALVAGDGLQVIAVYSPSEPWLITFFQYYNSGTEDIIVVNDTAYIVTMTQLLGLDVTTPWDPFYAFNNIYTNAYKNHGVEAANGLVYVANRDSGLTIIDPLHGPPYVTDNFPVDHDGCQSPYRDLVLVDDTIVYLGGELHCSMLALNVADPYAVDSIGSCGGHGQYPRGMDYEDDYVYVTRWEDGLFINDVSNRASPVEVGAFRECQDEMQDVEVQGDIGYLLFMDTIRIVDLSDPANITQIGWAEVGSNGALAVADDVLLVGNSRGVTSFDISNPATPIYLDMYLTDYKSVTGMVVRGHYAYISMASAFSGYGIGWGIIDISNSDSLVMVGSYLDEDYMPTRPNYGTNDMILCGGYALGGFWSPESYEYGFLVLDISDPSNPHGVAEHVTPYEILCATAMDSLLYFTTGGDSLSVWNISDILNPIPIARWHPTGYGSISPNIITNAGGYLFMMDFYKHNLLAVDPSGWSDTCGGGLIAKFNMHTYGTAIASGSNHVYAASLGGLAALTMTPKYICGDINGDSGATPNIADLTYLVAYLFAGGPPPPNLETADINGGDGKINIADLTYFVAYLFGGGPNPVCW